MTPEPVEVEAARLDDRLQMDPAAALRRFAIAAELHDDALVWVLDEQMLDHLPPPAWWSAFEQDPQVAPVPARLERIDGLPASVRDDRRAQTVHQLGWLLAEAYRAASQRLDAAMSPAERRPYERDPYDIVHDRHPRAWPFRGEYWADEWAFSARASSSCSRTPPARGPSILGSNGPR